MENLLILVDRATALKIAETAKLKYHENRQVSINTLPKHIFWVPLLPNTNQPIQQTGIQRAYKRGYLIACSQDFDWMCKDSNGNPNRLQIKCGLDGIVTKVHIDGSSFISFEGFKTLIYLNPTYAGMLTTRLLSSRDYCIAFTENGDECQSKRNPNDIRYCLECRRKNSIDMNLLVFKQ